MFAATAAKPSHHEYLSRLILLENYAYDFLPDCVAPIRRARQNRRYGESHRIFGRDSPAQRLISRHVSQWGRHLQKLRTWQPTKIESPLDRRRLVTGTL